MKKTINATICFLFIFAGLLFAQDFSGIKIYINPGHGGHDSDDRYIAATGYWESEGNLTKGLYLRDLLERLGATVIMSRTQNRTQDDRNLSEIDAEANANNVDYFHSIHSNAYNATSNYPLLLFRGYDDNPVFPEAKQMGHIMWTEMNKLNRQWTYWPYSSEDNRGDWDFYPWGTSGLGVLRTLEMPGTLSEGSFHDYIPNSWRLQCMDYRKHESVVILRSFIKYFGRNPLPYGLVGGLVRAKNHDVSYSFNYNSGLPNDKKRALNHAVVTLLPQHRVYITDDNNNGFFMFDSLQPGTYQVVFDADQYYPDTVNVDVKADETAFANAFLTDHPGEGPSVYASLPADSAADVSTYSNIIIDFSQAMDEASVLNAFSISPKRQGTLELIDQQRRLYFRPDSAWTPSTEYTVRLSDSAKNISGVKLNKALSFSYQTAAHHVNPQVLAFYPTTQDSAFNYTDLFIEFSQTMNTEKVEAAFGITPPVGGSISWQESNRKMVFKPDTLLSADSSYTVRISGGAENAYAVGLQENFSYTFKIRKKNTLDITRSFPHENEQGISPQMYFYLEFEKEIDQTTYSNNHFQIRSGKGAVIPLRKLTMVTENGRSRFTFKPKTELQRKLNYTLKIFPGIASLDGFKIQDTLYIHFKTIANHLVTGHILDGFETIDDWQPPLKDPLTSGMDSLNTGFIKNSSVKYNGSYAGRLYYIFKNDSGGLCRLYNVRRPLLGSDAQAEFGIWVFGDFSMNRLEFWFDHGDSSRFVRVADTLNWYGWKFEHFPLKYIEGSGKVFFQSIVVEQTRAGLKKAQLYFDDLQSDAVVGIGQKANLISIKKSFRLEQSYPNPFNPQTSIVFTLPIAAKTRLRVYNILGQKVAELLNKKMAAGRHQIKFNASNLASGVYIYELRSGGRVLRKRMILLR